ncbi:hypothetical protein [Amycolatopsis sp. GA6-003]|uniref:hypothetical protein n=1 Tax=Amycolatopsis sp. GA6-003 TaxID=2652444 RepID=UPI0039174184
MTASPGDGAELVRAIFAGAVEAGLRAESVRGASDAEIDAMATDQRARAVPAAAREVLRLIGTTHGLWLPGSSLGVEAVRGEAKNHAVATANAQNAELSDVDGALVLAAHGGYTYHVVDGADAEQDDPQVWLLTEDEPARVAWPSVSAWFKAITPDVERYRERLEIMRETGSDFLPPWAQDITVGG